MVLKESHAVRRILGARLSVYQPDAGGEASTRVILNPSKDRIWLSQVRLWSTAFAPTKTSKSLFRLESAQQNEDDHGE